MVKRGSGKSGTTPGRARGWATVVRIGRGGRRPRKNAKALQVVAVHVERGTGSTVAKRANLLARAIEAAPPNEPTLYLTTAGFFGVEYPAGSSVDDLVFFRPRRSSVEKALLRTTGDLPAHAYVLAGVDLDDDEYENQELWLVNRGKLIREPTMRYVQAPHERIFEVDGFRVLPFVCGEIYDGGFNPEADLKKVDVVVDAAHASVNRAHDRDRRWSYAPFQRMFLDIAPHAAAVLAHAHDDNERLVRCRNNWVVFRDEAPFPKPEKLLQSLKVARLP